MMWMRPRGPSDSAASRSNVGQCGQAEPARDALARELVEALAPLVA